MGKSFFVAALVIFISGLAQAQALTQAQPDGNDSSSLLLILDASGSMNSNDGSGQSKISAARQALYRMVDSLPEGSQVGLRVYGHRASNSEKDRAAGCRDTELIFPVQALSRRAMKDAIDRFQARGWTPIGSSLQAAERDLPESGQRTIVLVSDGLDTCGGPDPCEVARGLARRGVDLKIHTVGFQVDARAREQLKCIAEAAGGTYQDASDAGALSGQLKQLSARAIREFRTTGKSVKGSPSYHNAPGLKSGIYTDTIMPGERLWYGVELRAGQQLTVTTTVDRTRSLKTGFHSGVRVKLINPLLNEIANEWKHNDDRILSLGTQSNSVKESGAYYIRVEIDDFGMSGESQVELKVQIAGDRAQTEPGVDQNAGETQVNATIQSEGGPGGISKAVAMTTIGVGSLAVIVGAALFIAQRWRVLAWIRERRVSKETRPFCL